MQSSFYSSKLMDSLPNHWINWCRLCAREDNQSNINFFYQNEDHLKSENKRLSIQEALAKYFWVQTSIEDSLPKMLCTNCLSLVSSMINFNERVERVQLMFSHLTETQNSTINEDLSAIRLKFDLNDSEVNYYFSKCSYTEVEKRRNKFIVAENSTLSADDGKFRVQIKMETDENVTTLDYDKYIEENGELEKEEISFDDNGNYPFPEEDPFQKMDKILTEEEETIENPSQISLNTTELNVPKPKLDRSKNKRKRKKFEQFSNVDRKTRKTAIKDFKMEATCKECGKHFWQYMSYREHMQQQHDHSSSDKYWACPACDKTLLTLYHLERHVRIHVPLEVRRTIKCPDCDSRFTSNAQLETHIRYKHKNEKPFICEECGLCLRTNSNLRQHMLIHTDIAPFECEVCKKKFKNKIRLKTHMDIHSPNKHMCNICGLQLNSRATLNRHFLVHSEEMQHKCDYCGKAFKRAKALKNHLLLHTGLKPYSCDFCERTFANGSNCRSHMKKVHPEELAVLEASGNKTHTKNIPKLETLKAVTKAADNLTPVVTKFSGCFAFGKKPKYLEAHEEKQSPKLKQKLKKPKLSRDDNDNLALASPASTPLNLHYIPQVDNTTTSSCLNDAKNLDHDLSTSTLATATPIPNFDNIYQHLLKQNQGEIQIKQPLLQISPKLATNTVTTPHHNLLYHDIINHSIKPFSQLRDNLQKSPGSKSSSMTPSTHDDHSNSSSGRGAFYGSMRTTLSPGNFM